MNLKKIPDDICYLILSYIEENCYKCDKCINYKDLFLNYGCYKITHGKLKSTQQITTRAIIVKSWFEELYNIWFGEYYYLLCPICSMVRCRICYRLSHSNICERCQKNELEIDINFLFTDK